jgi:hypothetical protein
MFQPFYKNTTSLPWGLHPIKGRCLPAAVILQETNREKLESLKTMREISFDAGFTGQLFHRNFLGRLGRLARIALFFQSNQPLLI